MQKASLSGKAPIFPEEDSGFIYIFRTSVSRSFGQCEILTGQNGFLSEEKPALHEALSYPVYG